jgi:5-methylcytosine-specific restriction endonuclease McrBC GTP-binding regulatory subunit McrB
VELGEKGVLTVITPQSAWTCSDKKMLEYLKTRDCHPNDTYTKTIGDYILENYHVNSSSNVNPSKYIFIIDEINRGEISKIFGELFFAIDPGYRGKKGKVQTQYQNLITDESDPFKDGFYIPENVYIIGTMNDIDRSVECMDFAMRRRFTFKEITAEESAKNMGVDPDRMKCLNNAISEIEGFNSSFHIGAAYFRGVTDYEELWELKLQGLLKEYLRGMPDAEENLNTLKEAYFKTEE